MDHSVLTSSDLMKPFVMLFDFARSFKIMLGDVPFTFFEMWTWGILAVILLWFINFVLDNK